jgi:hypothetical protein
MALSECSQHHTLVATHTRFFIRYTVDSVGPASVAIHFLGGPSLIVPVVYAAAGGLAYYLQSPAFLQSEIVTDAKLALFAE